MPFRQKTLYLGTPIGNLLCYMCICALNIFSIRSLLSEPPALVRNLARPFMAALIMGILTWLSWYGLKQLGIGSRLILCAAPILVGVVVYCLAAVKLKVITRSDCMLLPKGEKIAKLLRL